MMAVLQATMELCSARIHPQHAINDISTDDPATYEKSAPPMPRAFFQIESRAQMAPPSRFKPKNLYDLAIQVAIIRPGPITGNLVLPLIRRRDGLEAVDYIEPSVAEIVQPILGRTRGVILFQKQMLELSIKLAHLTGGAAEKFLRAMAFKVDRRHRREREPSQSPYAPPVATILSSQKSAPLRPHSPPTASQNRTPSTSPYSPTSAHD
jgi:error-prone DNA polymerase